MVRVVCPSPVDSRGWPLFPRRQASSSQVCFHPPPANTDGVFCDSFAKKLAAVKSILRAVQKPLNMLIGAIAFFAKRSIFKGLGKLPLTEMIKRDNLAKDLRKPKRFWFSAGRIM